jgi:hypothetical protein
MQNVHADIAEAIRERIREFNEKAGRGSGFAEEKITDLNGPAIAWTKATFPAAFIKAVQRAPEQVEVVVQRRQKGQPSFQNLVRPILFNLLPGADKPFTSFADALDGPLTALFTAIAAPHLRDAPSEAVNISDLLAEVLSAIRERVKVYNQSATDAGARLNETDGNSWVKKPYPSAALTVEPETPDDVAIRMTFRQSSDVDDEVLPSVEIRREARRGPRYIRDGDAFASAASALAQPLAAFLARVRRNA